MSPYYAHYDVSPDEGLLALHRTKYWMSLSVDGGSVHVGPDDKGELWLLVRAGFRDNVLIAPEPLPGKRLSKRRKATWVHEIDSHTALTCDASSHVHVQSELFDVHHGFDHDDQPFLCVSDDSRTFLFRRPGVRSAWSQRWSKRVPQGQSFKVEVGSSGKREGVTALARALSMVALKGKA